MQIMKRVITILIALLVLGFTQCKPAPEGGDENNTEKVRISCNLPVNNSGKSDFANIMGDGTINWSNGRECIYLAIHGDNPQIVELEGFAENKPSLLEFTGEVSKDLIVSGNEYDIWYFGHSQQLSDSYYNLADDGSKLSGSIANQSGRLEDLGYCHIASTKVIATIENDKIKLTPIGAFNSQMAIALLDLENVSELYGNSIIGTEYSLEYNGEEYELKVIRSESTINVESATGISYIVLFPNNEKERLLKSKQGNKVYAYTFHNGIRADNKYYRIASDGQTYESLIWKRIELATHFFYDFNDNNLNDFIINDADGDGSYWNVYKYSDVGSLYSISSSEISPDNFIYTKEPYSITSTSNLKGDKYGNYFDKYSVIVSEDEKEWTEIYIEAFDKNTTNSYVKKTIDIGGYAGRSLYIGFRHYDSDNCAMGVLIDNIQLSTTNESTNTDVPMHPYEYYRGHEYVDLGLPSGLKWATVNIGYHPDAAIVERHFAWGSKYVTSEYDYTVCPTWNKPMDDISGNPDYDVARSSWGGGWRIPTKTELQELIQYCTISISDYSTTLTGPNGNSITLSHNGVYIGPNINERWIAFYWSSTPSSDENGWCMSINGFNDTYSMKTQGRYYGCSVRAVID